MYCTHPLEYSCTSCILKTAYFLNRIMYICTLYNRRSHFNLKIKNEIFLKSTQFSVWGLNQIFFHILAKLVFRFFILFKTFNTVALSYKYGKKKKISSTQRDSLYNDRRGHFIYFRALSSCRTKYIRYTEYKQISQYIALKGQCHEKSC